MSINLRAVAAIPAPVPALRPFPTSFSTNLPPAPAHLILRAAVRGWAHVFNKPPRDPVSGRPPRCIWMPPFLRSTGEAVERCPGCVSPKWRCAARTRRRKKGARQNPN